ncbi:predicted protein [Naegleria gruberi]|uniref:Predicted protein n=1 Tax=Naegleria gruberi TaxID=5762 RepID=D2VBY6_NAEGR|nr:uncharacterized protein NAEGRDRAFT_66382 [Naegleria gruberi]EFC45560.1 predicted protein [Naegleria gruberi]|eukprot:XP_002678304.1 predicted protein [Naegleria gruberi strain NEG-M]
MEEPRFLNIDCMFGLLSPHQQYSLLNNLMINLHQDKLSVQFPTEVVQDRILTFSEDRVDFYVCMMVMRGLLKELVHREILINNQKRTVKQDESWICFAQKLCCLEYDDGVKEGEVSYETRKLVAELYNTFLWRQVPIDKSKLSKTLHKNCNFYHWSAMIDYVMSNVLFKHVTPGLVILEHCSFDDKGEYHKHQGKCYITTHCFI